jgi:hypothetical protein
MPGLRSELPPVSEAVTNHIRVEVLSQYSRENSDPQKEAWVFQYTVRITTLFALDLFRAVRVPAG